MPFFHGERIRPYRPIFTARAKRSINRIKHEKLMRRNKPRGSLASELGRKLNKGTIIFINANSASKGQRKAGRC